MRTVLALAILALSACSCAKHPSPEGPVDDEGSRLAAGVVLSLAGGAAEKAIALDDEHKLGQVGCVTLDALSDVLPVVGRAVIADAKGFPSFVGENAIDVCGCVETYGLPPLDGLDAALAASFERDLDTVGILSASVIRDCKARAWTVATVDFAKNLVDPLAAVFARGACRVEVVGSLPDLSACE